MERQAWLRERRAVVEAQYDLESPEYDALEYPIPLHGRCVDKLFGTTAPGATILDAPCGTGKYFAQVVAAGRRVVGVDQSAGMLAQAQAKALAESLHHVGLQEMAFDSAFDGAMTIDAMENVPPEDWPQVVANLRRALRSGAHLYLTLEELNEPEIEEAHGHQRDLGWPSVRGEVIEGDTAGYHHYSGRNQALEWLSVAGFRLVEEDMDWQQGWGYRHFLLATE